MAATIKEHCRLPSVVCFLLNILGVVVPFPQTCPAADEGLETVCLGRVPQWLHGLVK